MITLAISVVVGMLGSSYSLFMNAIGKIQLQLYILAAQALLFFPLSYMFFKFGFGLVSVVLPQIIFAFASAAFMRVQYNKVVMQKAEGIWIK